MKRSRSKYLDAGAEQLKKDVLSKTLFNKTKTLNENSIDSKHFHTILTHKIHIFL